MTIQARTGGEGKDDYAAREPARLSPGAAAHFGERLRKLC